MAGLMKEMMAKRIGPACASTIFAALLCSPAAMAEPSEEIRAALDNWTKAFNSRDAGHVCDLFARDLVAAYQGQPERNYDAICLVIEFAQRSREILPLQSPSEGDPGFRRLGCRPAGLDADGRTPG